MQSGMVWSVWLVNQGLADILLPIQLVRCSSRFVNTCNSAQPSQCTICTIVLLTALKYFKHIWNFWYTVGVTWASEVVRFQCHDSLYLNWCRAKPNVQSHKLVICTVPQCCTMLHNVADSLRLGSDSQLILPWVKGTVNPLSQSLYPLQVDYVYFFLWLNNMIRLWFTLCYALLRFATLCYALLRFATLCYALLRFATLCYALLRFATLCYALHIICEVQSPLHTVSVNVMKGSAPSTKLWKMWWKGSGTTAHCFWQIIWNASFRMFQNVSEHCENCFKCQTVLKHLETIPDSRMTLFCLNGRFGKCLDLVSLHLHSSCKRWNTWWPCRIRAEKPEINTTQAPQLWPQCCRVLHGVFFTVLYHLAWALLSAHFNRNFRILKWRYCTI